MSADPSPLISLTTEQVSLLSGTSASISVVDHDQFKLIQKSKCSLALAQGLFQPPPPECSQTSL